MSQSDEFENIKTQYIASLTSKSKIKSTKAVFSKLEDFLKENNLSFKDLSHNRDNFKVYLQNKVSEQSFYVYFSAFQSFYKWLETEHLKVEPVFRPHELEPPAIEQKSELEPPQKPPCNYASLVEDKKQGILIYCDNPKRKELPKDRLIPISVCQTCWNRREWSIQKRQQQASVQVEKREETEEETSVPVFKKPKRPMEEIVNELGVCLNPILMKQVSKTDYGGLLCHVCRNQNYEKWLACEEIIKELKNPVTYSAFIRSMTEKESDWWQTPNSDQMTLEEIEELYGLRESSKPRQISCTKFCSDLKIMNCEKYPSCDLNTGVSKPEEELDVFDIAEREAEPLRFREGKTIPEARTFVRD